MHIYIYVYIHTPDSYLPSLVKIIYSPSNVITEIFNVSEVTAFLKCLLIVCEPCSFLPPLLLSVRACTVHLSVHA